ncbi:peptidoglycan-binding domain-containing protein [Streptodolium elevatio]|uniref:Peptidoglycan-binding domain-containing protein n=1 Tax=Streptodolium elevatio TaxID=3157996 RepID=A0ABV3DVN0_9ACTN
MSLTEPDTNSPPDDGLRSDQPPGTRRGRRTVLAGAAVTTVLAAVAAGVFVLRGEDDAGRPAQAGPLPPRTTEVTRQSLKDTRTVDGELGFGPTTAVTGRRVGTITGVPKTGDRIARGQPVYAVDAEPVPLLYGALPAYRSLVPGVEGEDVRQLEENLWSLGYRGFTVDDDYTEATAEAVADWQEDLGVPETGVLELGRAVFAPGEIRVDSVKATVGAAATAGGEVLTYTGRAKAVTAALDTTDQRLAAKDAEVTVTLPDDTTVRGRVHDVATVIEPATGPNEQPATKVEVVVALDDPQAQQAATPYALAAVDVTFTAGTRENVLTVPVAALLALPAGGFGVEVVTGATTRHVPVSMGLFASGRVEVSGEGLAEGTVVGMPK